MPRGIERKRSIEVHGNRLSDYVIDRHLDHPRRSTTMTGVTVCREHPSAKYGVTSRFMNENPLGHRCCGGEAHLAPTGLRDRHPSRALDRDEPGRADPR